MNKKFSTLLASVLLTSAFTVNAQALVEGDYVRLKVGDVSNGYLTVTTNGLAKEGVASKTPDTGETYKDVFAGINSQLWKIAKITKAGTTGIETYQFINKQTGEYLAFKLRTDNGKAYTTKGVAKLDPAGNKEWAFDGEKLYVYDSTQDSTFFLNSSLHLVSKKGKNTDGAAKVFKETLKYESMSLKADAFNALMKLTGNDGKLHFNGKKNVSEDEKNVLENTKWTAVDGGNGYIYLKNGKTKSGYTNDLRTYTEDGKKKYHKIDKNEYLQVDTLAYDDADKYFALVADTIPSDAYSVKVGDVTLTGSFSDNRPTNIATRNNETAEWKANYFFANDSIALKVKSVPEKMSAVRWISDFVEVEDYDAKYADAVMAAAAHADWQQAINTLDAAYATFIATENATTSVVNFNEGTNADLIAALEAANVDALKAYAAALKNVKKAAATVTDGQAQLPENYAATLAQVQTISGINTDSKLTEVETIVTAFAAYQNSSDQVVNFKDTYFTTTGVAPEQTEGSDRRLGSAFLANVTNNASNASEIEKGVVADFVAMLTAWSCPAQTTSNGAVEGVSAEYATLKAEADAISAKNEALVAALAALDEAYKEFASCEGWYAVDEDKTFEDWAGDDEINAVKTANALNDDAVNSFVSAVSAAYYKEADRIQNVAGQGKHFTNGQNALNVRGTDFPVALRKLSSATVLTVNADHQDGYIYPLIQPYATTGGDAKIATTNYHFIQVKNEAKMPTLRAADEAKLTNKYYVVDWTSGEYADIIASSEVSEFNPYTQWAFVEASTGSYSIINRATERVLYTGPLFKVADAANTYTNGTDTLKIAAVTLPESTIITEGTKKYDVSGSFYPGKDEQLIKRLFTINPASPFLSQLAVQFNKDSVMILGNPEDAPVWQLAEVKDSKKPYGYTIEGTAPLLRAQYNLYTTDRDNNVYYVTLNSDWEYVLTKSTSEEGADPSKFTFIELAENQYVIKDEQQKMTINPTPANPILEASNFNYERNDLFTFTQVNQNVYRTLAAEDGVLGNAKIYMENEPNRYLYENTANIVANNGKGYNFLGIYNTAELTKNAALFVDTAYVNREDNLMPQYMLGLGVETVEAQDAVACTYEHNHYDNAGNKVDAAHCSHATPATLGYKTGRYLVALTDSVPTTTKVHPTLYDGAIRLAFVDAIHYLTQDTVVIKKSKWTGNDKQIEEGKETTYASKDTIAISDALNPATFALQIKDQATKSFYLENKEGYVRILNGVPVLTTKIEDAAVFNIAATEEDATANEAIAAEGVQVIAGKGVVTVQGAAGKVITVANILGQTIANQVAASDNVTIAVPAGIVVVAVEGEATKVVVK